MAAVAAGMPWKEARITSGSDLERAEPAFDRAGDLLDVVRVVVIGRSHPQGRLATHLRQGLEDLVAGGGGRGGRVLGIERHEQQPVASLVGQPADRRFQRRIAVAHAPVDDDVDGTGAEQAAVDRSLQPFGLGAGDGLERALVALAVPDRRVILALPSRPRRQDQAVEDEEPQKARGLDHATIGQELRQISPHRPVARPVGRAEVAEQHADLALGDGVRGDACEARLRCAALQVRS